MIKQNQNGSVGAVVSIVLLSVFLVCALGFAGWAFMSRQDYKNNVDEKITSAVVVAKQEESSKKDKEFLEKEKEPYRTYVGPSAYGSINVIYPKTWSGAVDEKSSSSGTLVDAYFHPAIVPSLASSSSSFALRLKVVGQSYATSLKSIQSLQKNKERPSSVAPYALPKVPSVVGVKVDGGILNEKTGSMIVLPLRSQTLYIWTEGDTYKGDFNNIILPNLTFSP